MPVERGHILVENREVQLHLRRNDEGFAKRIVWNSLLAEPLSSSSCMPRITSMFAICYHLSCLNPVHTSWVSLHYVK